MVIFVCDFSLNAFAQNEKNKKNDKDVCLDVANIKPLTEIVFSDGSRLTVLEKSESFLRYQMNSKNGARFEVSTFGGFFTNSAKDLNSGRETILNWSKDLKEFFPFFVGQRFKVDAQTIERPSGKEFPYKIDVLVLSNERLDVGNCYVDVLKIDTRDLVSNKSIVRFFDPVSKISFRTEIHEPKTSFFTDRMVEYYVVSINNPI